jgi:alpha-1,2-glucosyltransferase
MAVIAAFAVFALVNGGIVVGDREAHRPALHLAQLPYFSLFTAAAFAPLWLPSSMYVSDL